MTKKTDLNMAMMPQTLAANYLAAHLPEVNGKANTVHDVLLDLLKKSMDVRRNKAGFLEDMLLSQATVLNMAFFDYLDMADNSSSIEAKKVYMNIAMKAQSLSRCAAETLSDIKNPRPVFQQNNLAHNQQVNNGVPPPSHGENSKSTNELLTDRSDDHATMDYGRAKAAIGDDKNMVAVEAINGAEII